MAEIEDEIRAAKEEMEALNETTNQELNEYSDNNDEIGDDEEEPEGDNDSNEDDDEE